MEEERLARPEARACIRQMMNVGRQTVIPLTLSPFLLAWKRSLGGGEASVKMILEELTRFWESQHWELRKLTPQCPGIFARSG